MRGNRHDPSTQRNHRPGATISLRPRTDLFNEESDRPQQDVSGEHCHQHRSLEAINANLDTLHAECAANETALQLLLEEWDSLRRSHEPIYWLTLTRIAELTLLTAGAYADGCEFQASGDLLVNPARILIHLKGQSAPKLKKRHMSISATLQADACPERPFIEWYRDNALIEVARRALLPDLVSRMEASGSIGAPYLESFDTRMRKVTDTIAFLSAWQITNSDELYARVKNSSPETRSFIEANLCRFSDTHFLRMGEDIRRMENDDAGDGRTAFGCEY